MYYKYIDKIDLHTNLIKYELVSKNLKKKVILKRNLVCVNNICKTYRNHQNPNLQFGTDRRRFTYFINYSILIKFCTYHNY